MRKTVLSEESFVSALDIIIRRQFYPELGIDPQLLALAHPQAIQAKSLDEFLSRFTSEDNAALSSAIDQMKTAHRQKYYWIDAEKSKLRLLQKDEHDKQQCIRYVPRNALMFPPSSSSDLSTTTAAAAVVEIGSDINLENTRFPDAHFEMLREMFVSNSSAKECLIYGGRKKSEYRLLLTPDTGGFRIPEPRKRDEVARVLADKAKRSLEQTVTPTPLERSSRRRRLEDFSPAAQRLLRKQ
jgi:hypothetical protein